jgi:putative oxidoreductase
MVVKELVKCGTTPLLAPHNPIDSAIDRRLDVRQQVTGRHIHISVRGSDARRKKREDAVYIPGLNITVFAPYGLAILRVVLGIAFAVHGWGKFSGGVDGVAGFFGTLGIPAPMLIAWIVTIVELVGGILLIVGFLTQLAAILLFINMIGAIVYAYISQGAPFIDRGAVSFEKEAVFAAAALCLALAGPGVWAVDDMLAESRGRDMVA